MTVAEALAQAQRLGVDRIEAQWLLAGLLEQSRSWLAAHADERLDGERQAAWIDRVRRLADGEPLAYLTGEQTFHGLDLRVDARVLVPRSDTELLVDWALEWLAATAGPAPHVLDLGTGSGAIALAVARAQPRARVTATDLSDDALVVARANAERLGFDIDWRLGRWWSAVEDCRFDLVLSNPPYIALGDSHLAALGHEPALALTAGADGLDAIRAIVGGAWSHLEPGGRLMIEHGFDQAAAVRALLVDADLVDVQTRRDTGGRERCSSGRKPTS